MDASFSPQELAFRDEVRAFIRKNLPDDLRAKVTQGLEMDKNDYQRWMMILGKQGWLATNWPEEHGGPGWNVAQKYIYEEEMAVSACPEIVPFGTRMVGPVLIRYGTKQQQDQHLPGIVSGETIWCQGYSEPGAGSDLAALTCSAAKDGDDYIINGSKIWTTQAHIADWMFALVRTSKEEKKQDGITCLLIKMDSPGLEVRPLIKLDGRHKFNQEFFTDVRVPQTNRVGDEGQGWSIAKYLLGHERSSGAGVAGARMMLDLLKKVALDQQADGGALAEDPAFKQKIAELETQLATLQFTSWRVLAGASADQEIKPEAAAGLKLGMAGIRQSISEVTLAAGGYSAFPYNQNAIRHGWNEEPIGPDYLFKMAPDYFEYRARSIAGGSNEVQKNVIAKRVLGL
ncbi:MAG: acyl-CoA dehydrogenase family protein [Alphaproteobacteria bacterium]|jgi:alkylation response protein AidB-like acyl-CoA dehydrogenase